MNITRNFIYDYIEHRVNLENSPVYCSSKVEPIDKHFPACFICETNNFRERQNATLNNDDEQYRAYWEIQIFATDLDGSVERAEEIFDRADAGFRELGFFCSYKNPVDNIDSRREFGGAGKALPPTITRIIARYDRLICGADNKPQ